jgi:hypothetical protein
MDLRGVLSNPHPRLLDLFDRTSRDGIGSDDSGPGSVSNPIRNTSMPGLQRRDARSSAALVAEPVDLRPRAPAYTRLTPAHLDLLIVEPTTTEERIERVR